MCLYNQSNFCHHFVFIMFEQLKTHLKQTDTEYTNY